MANQSTLSIRISVDGTQATSAIQGATQSINNLGQSAIHANTTINNVDRSIHNLGNTTNVTNTTINNFNNRLGDTARAGNTASGAFNLLKTALAGIGFGIAIKEIASFETKLLSLQALTGSTAKQMKELENQARSLGATTQFSAQQAAEAQGVLASAGLKVNEILSATPQVMQLAAAGALDLAKAAEISIAAMHGMGLGLKDLGHINDVLVQASNDYTINVEMLGHALGETAVVAKTYGVSLEATASSLGILKESGMEAGSIGDALKGLFGALVNDTKENTKILELYTVGLDKHKMTYKDLNVETLGYTKVLQNLKDAQIGATDMTKLFGESASTAAIGLSAHIDKIKENEVAYIKLNGVAEKQTEILNQGLSKAWDALKGTLSEAALKLGESGAKIDETGKATGGLKVGLTDLITEVTGVIAIYEGLGKEFAKSNKLTDEQYKNLKNIAGELKSFGGAVGGIAAVTGAIWAANAAMVAFNATARMNPFVMGATAIGAGLGMSLANKNNEQQKNISLMEKSNSVEEAGLKIAQQREKINSFKEKAKNFVSDGRTGEENQRLLKILEQRRDELIYYANHPKVSAIPDGVDGDIIKPVANHSKSLDVVEEDKAAKKAATAAQRELNKEQEGYRKLIESTPIGKYNADMLELNNAFKKGGIDQLTYNELTAKTASEFEKATVGIEKLTEAEKERQRIFDQTARGKFEKSTDELRAQKPFMSESDYANKQDKIGVDYLHETGQNKDAKTQIDSIKDAETATKSFHDEITKTTTAFDNLGNSGKMAFDGLLGGISAVAGAATSFGEEMAKLNDNFAKGSKDYSEYMKRVDISEQQRTDATKDYYAMKSKYESASLATEINGARQIAGAAAKMFGEKTVAAKAFHGIEMGLAVVSMAMSAKKMVVDIAAGAAAMFGQGGFAGFAGVAAMGAVMAGLGVAMSGGSKTVDMTTKATGDTGTVKGDSAASSNSIMDSLHLLNDTGWNQLLELKDLNANFTSLAQGVDKTVATAINLHGSFTPSTQGMKSTQTNSPLGSAGMVAGNLALSAGAGALGLGASGAAAIGLGGLSTAMSGAAISTGLAVGASSSTAIMAGGAILGLAGGLVLAGLTYGLGKLLGIGKTKYTAIGNGIVTNAATMTLDGMTQAATAYDYSTIKAKTKGWFSSTTKIYDVMNGVDIEMTNAITSVFGSLGKALGVAFKDLGISDLVGKSAVLPSLKFDLSNAKTDQEISDVITKSINTMSDKLATELAGGLFSAFQKTGEGMVQTITRISVEVANVSSAFSKLGMNLKLSGMNAITFSDALVSVFESAPNANDALKNFVSSINAFTDTILTPLQKLQYSMKNWTDFATAFNEKNATKLDLNLVNLSSDKIMAAYSEVTDKLATASTAESNLTKNSQAVTDATTPYTATDLGNQLTASAWSKEITGKYENMTTSSFTNPKMWDYVQSMAQSNDTYKNLYADIVRVVTTNESKKSKGLEATTAAGIDLSTFDTEVSKLKDTTKDAAQSVAELTAQQSAYKTMLEFNSKVFDTNESILKKLTTSQDTLNRSRANELKLLDNKLDISSNVNLTKQTIDAFHKWNPTLVLTQFNLERFNQSLEDTAKATKTLADANKYFSDFSTSIKAWVQNLKATSLGTPESQMSAAQSNFDKQMAVIDGGLSTSAEEKRTALSGITGVADTLINSLKNYYGSSQTGQDAIYKIVDKVSALNTNVDIPSLQLGVLEQIREGIYTLPSGLSETQSKFIQGLATTTQNLEKAYQLAPTSDNNLKADTSAKIFLMAEAAAGKGSAFIDDFIKNYNSAGGTGGLFAAVSLVVKDATLDSATKQTVMDNVLNNFNTMTITNVHFDGVAAAQTAINAGIKSMTIEPVYLKADTTNADNTIVKITSKDGSLGKYDNSSFTSTLNAKDNASAVVGSVDKNGNSTGVTGKVLAFGALDKSATIGITDNASSPLATIKTAAESATQALKDFMTVSATQQALLDKAAADKAANDAKLAQFQSQPVNPNDGMLPQPLKQSSLLDGISYDKNATIFAQGEKLTSAASTVSELNKALKGTDKSLINVYANRLAGWNSAHPNNVFANGGAFTNGIVDRPTAFDMGLMGENGSEGILPLHNINGSLGVKAIVPAANDSGSDNAETIAELKETNAQLINAIKVLQNGFNQLLAENQKQTDSLEVIERKTRIQAAA